MEIFRLFFKFILIVLMLQIGLKVCAAETTSALLRGPQVEIALKSGSVLKGVLLQMSEQKLEILMGTGERVAKPLNEIRSVSFVANTNKDDPADTDPEVDNKEGDLKNKNQLSLGDNLRMRALKHKERVNTLTPAEEEEFRKLKKHVSPILRNKLREAALAAEEAVRTAVSKGQLETYITQLQTQLKNVQTEEAAKESLFSLMIGYRQKNIPQNKQDEQLKTDTESILNLKVREKVKEQTPEILKFLRAYRSSDSLDKSEKPLKK
jgi:hypothetical protein